MKPTGLRANAATRPTPLQWTAIGLFLGVQFTTTVLGHNHWPFSSFDMFSRPTSRRMWHFRIRLLTTERVKAPMEVCGLLPLEHFRTTSVFKQIYLGKLPEDRKLAFSVSLVDCLSKYFWKNRDQVRASPKLTPGERVIGFELLRVLIDLDTYIPQDDSPFAATRIVYRYRFPEDSPCPC